MALSAAVIDALVAAGATVEQLAAAVKADLAEGEARAARQVPWPMLRQMAFERDGQVCAYCRDTDGPFEVDHIVPIVAGGENVLANVAVACRSCNRAKKDRQGDDWEALRDRRERDRDRKRASRNGGQKRKSANVTRTKADPPNDIYSNPQNSLSAKADCPSLAEKVVEAWNSGPKVRGANGATALDANRRKLLSLRTREHGEEAVFTAISNLAASPFHCGTNDRGWRANIGWLLKSPENFIKALELEPDRPPGCISDLAAQASRYAQHRKSA